MFYLALNVTNVFTPCKNDPNRIITAGPTFDDQKYWKAEDNEERSQNYDCSVKYISGPVKK